MSDQAMIRVILVDDHPVVRFGLAAIIGLQPDMVVVAEAGSGEEACSIADGQEADVVLMDLRLPGMSGAEAIRALKKAHPKLRFIVLTTYDGDEDIHTTPRFASVHPKGRGSSTGWKDSIIPGQMRASVASPITPTFRTGIIAFTWSRMRWTTRAIRRILVTFESSGSPLPLGAEGVRSLLMIIREALQNAVRHADPRKLSILLGFDPRGLEVEIEDDGCGFDSAMSRWSDDRHYGLVGMRERVEQLGGKFSLTSSPGKGTQVRMRIPLAGGTYARILKYRAWKNRKRAPESVTPMGPPVRKCR